MSVLCQSSDFTTFLPLLNECHEPKKIKSLALALRPKSLALALALRLQSLALALALPLGHGLEVTGLVNNTAMFALIRGRGAASVM